MRLAATAVAAVAVGLVVSGGCKRVDPAERGRRILHVGLRSEVASLDPVHAGDEATSLAQSLVYETLFEYDYETRPLRLRPLLLTRMPEVSDDAKSYTFTLRDDVRFHDHAAFEDGVGRTVTSTDVVYSFKRMADASTKPKGWWLFAGRITGFDDYKQTQNAAPSFDYDAPVEGLEIVDARTFRIHLVAPYPQLLNVLAMSYTAVVAREVVESYGQEVARFAVGTGPFRLSRWSPGVELAFAKNDAYRDVRYRGERVPFLDGVDLHVFAQEQPMWLKWRVGDVDLILVPFEYQASLLDGEQRLRETFRKEGVGHARYERLDLVYRGFDMEDPIVGGFGRGKKLRQALSLAYDGEEFAEAFYAGAVTLYDGPIPPGLEGYAPGVLSPYRGPDLAKAKVLLAEAGYPDGQGLPPLQFHTYRGGTSPEQGEMLARQWAKIGVLVETHLHSFPELDRRIKQKKAQMFSLAWGSDYPDAENNLAMFYGPNRVPGSNNFNYANPEYDALYERARVMSPSPERTALYVRMRDMIIEDVPFLGGFARQRHYAWTKRTKNVRPDETWWSWIKLLDVEPR